MHERPLLPTIFRVTHCSIVTSNAYTQRHVLQEFTALSSDAERGWCRRRRRRDTAHHHHHHHHWVDAGSPKSLAPHKMMMVMTAAVITEVWSPTKARGKKSPWRQYFGLTHSPLLPPSFTLCSILTCFLNPHSLFTLSHRRLTHHRTPNYFGIRARRSRSII